MVRAVLDEVCGTQEAQHGSGWAAGERNVIFYADDGRIAGRYHKWVHDALSAIVAIFCRMGLKKTLKKTKTMVCMSCFIWGKWGSKRKIGGRWEKGHDLGRGRGFG